MLKQNSNVSLIKLVAHALKITQLKLVVTHDISEVLFSFIGIDVFTLLYIEK